MTEFTDTWKDMPQAVAILTLSWEDIVPTATQITQSKWKRNPTEDEIKEIFEHVAHRGLDCESGTYWTLIEVECQDYYQGGCTKCGIGECDCE